MKRTNTKKMRKPKNRSTKIHLVFDEQKRKDFLTGFHKRKLQRKKKAQEDLTRQLKDERKRLKLEAKESYKKLTVSCRPVPEVEGLISDEYEDENVMVKVVELSAKNIAEQNNWIGPNAMSYETEIAPSSPSPVAQEEIPGMGLKEERAVVSEKQTKPTFTSKKHLKKTLKKEATQKVKKSKVFQMKNKIERRKQKKESLKSKKLKMKLLNKNKRRRNDVR